MNYGKIKNCDIADGVGVRVTLFVSGCTNHCKGCFQPETWDFGFGEVFTDAVADDIIRMLQPEYIDGLTLLGGEPFEPSNQRALLPFLKRVRSECPGKTVWAYSGFTFEEMLRAGTHVHTPVTKEILSMVDVLVDGRFEEDKRDLTLMFRGSSNQRVLDVPKSLASGKPVVWAGLTR